MTFHAGNVPGEVTNLLITDFDPLLDDTISGVSGISLDDMIVDGTATITVSAVPEPSSGVLFGLLLPVAAWWRKRSSGQLAHL